MNTATESVVRITSKQQDLDELELSARGGRPEDERRQRGYESGICHQHPKHDQ